MKKRLISSWLILLMLALPACQPAAPDVPPGEAGALRVLAVESFLADMAQQVAGDRLTVGTLMPLGIDPHAFEPAPRDVAKIADCDVLIVNGAGFEAWLKGVLDNAGGRRAVIEAAAGLASRTAREGEVTEPGANEPHGGEDHPLGDPHFWLDPVNAITYVETIRAGLTAADPGGRDTYTRNAAAYITRLKELDGWIRQQVAQVPPERRQMVTNHESFGYFADRYGFQIIGTIVPSVSTQAAPSAQQLAQLMDRVKATGVTAIFLETGANPQLARQIAQETGVTVVADLFTHSISGPDGPAPDYIAMMKHNAQAIVAALK